MKYRNLALLSFAFGYANVSYYFLHHPEKLHLKNFKTQSIQHREGRLIYAHRGGSIENPENTLQAFKASAALGVAIETDVRSTKDGQIIINHDDNLLRMTGHDIKVSETNLVDLPRQYVKQIEVEFGHHDYMINEGRDQAEICTLEDLFQIVPQTQLIQIDIKDALDKSSCLRVRQLVEKYGRDRYTIVGTTRSPAIDNVREAFKGTNVMFLASLQELLFYTACYFTGLAPFMKFKGIDVFSIPWMTNDTSFRYKARMENTSSVLSPSYLLHFFWVKITPLLIRMTDGMIRHVERRGIHSNIWVVNSDHEVE